MDFIRYLDRVCAGIGEEQAAFSWKSMMHVIILTAFKTLTTIFFKCLL